MFFAILPVEPGIEKILDSGTNRVPVIDDLGRITDVRFRNEEIRNEKTVIEYIIY
jgi:hypothetical protein